MTKSIIVAVLFIGCGASEDGDTGAGGRADTQLESTGGALTASTGSVPGAPTNVHIVDDPMSGGSVSTGGSFATGGAATGGASMATGGNATGGAATGGKASTGGAVSTGGVTATGGSATGGVPAVMTGTTSACRYDDYLDCDQDGGCETRTIIGSKENCGACGQICPLESTCQRSSYTYKLKCM